jgi:hypothetical protein
MSAEKLNGSQVWEPELRRSFAEWKMWRELYCSEAVEVNSKD